METFKAVYINEMVKMLKKKKIIISLIFSTISILAISIIMYLLNNFAGIYITGSSELSIITLTILIYSIVPLFTVFVSIDVFAGEFSDNTIKSTLTRPASRFKVFLGKTLAIATFIVGILIFIMLLSMIISLIINKGILNPFKVLLSYVMMFIPMFVFALVVILISNITGGTTSAFMLSIFVFIVFNGLGFIFPQIRSFLFTSTFEWYRLILGSYVSISKIIRVLLILLGYIIMLASGTFYLFEKRDI